jgi:tetratricopeptide (TPR) repeat protein
MVATKKSHFAFIFLVLPYLVSSFTVHYGLQKKRIIPTALHERRTIELDNDENLKALFERAVVLQRSGSHMEALEEYERFIKAAKSTKQEPKKYAEVFVNMGAIQLKSKNREMAKHYFKEAIKYRKIGTAYVNLALLALQEGSQSGDPQVGLNALREAKDLCEKATELEEDKQSVATAAKLLDDIDIMLKQTKG